MMYFLHYLHFVFDLLVEDAILHKLALVKFLGRKGDATECSGHFVDSSKGTLADFADAVVLSGACPRLGKALEPRRVFLCPLSLEGRVLWKEPSSLIWCRLGK